MFVTSTALVSPFFQTLLLVIRTISRYENHPGTKPPPCNFQGRSQKFHTSVVCCAIRFLSAVSHNICDEEALIRPQYFHIAFENKQSCFGCLYTNISLVIPCYVLLINRYSDKSDMHVWIWFYNVQFLRYIWNPWINPIISLSLM